MWKIRYIRWQLSTAFLILRVYSGLWEEYKQNFFSKGDKMVWKISNKCTKIYFTLYYEQASRIIKSL